jgi:hypothetical protein
LDNSRAFCFNNHLDCEYSAAEEPERVQAFLDSSTDRHYQRAGSALCHRLRRLTPGIVLQLEISSVPALKPALQGFFIAGTA